MSASRYEHAEPERLEDGSIRVRGVEHFSMEFDRLHRVEVTREHAIDLSFGSWSLNLAPKLVRMLADELLKAAERAEAAQSDDQARARAQSTRWMGA